MSLAPRFDLLRDDWPLLAASDEPVTRKLNVVAPFDGAAIAQVAVAGERHVYDALFAAFSMFRQKDRWLSVERRLDVLGKAVELIQTNAALFALETARETGQPLRQCQHEVARVIELGRATCLALQADTGDVLPAGAVGATDPNELQVVFGVPEPVGVVVALLGRNQPLAGAAIALFSAIASGCPLILKPAEDTPLAALRLVHLSHEAGLPYVWSQAVVTETREITRHLVTDPRVALLRFNGSAEVGWALRAQLPPGTRCVLEHSSVAPAIVADDANTGDAVSAIIASAMLESTPEGESLQRVFVGESQAETFAHELAARANELQLGDPLLSATDVGPLVRDADVERVMRWVASAIESGAQLLCGGERAGNCGFKPTVLFEPSVNAELSTRPAGAPVICVYAVNTLEEACDRANALPFARSACVFTASNDSAVRVFRWLDASNVVVNDRLGVRSPRQTLDGLRRSGLGGSGLPAVLRSMQIRKSIVMRSSDLV